MSYEKQNFKSGQTLTAEHLNHMEEGIVEAEKTGGSGSTASLTIGTVTTGDTAAASITEGRLNLTLPRGETGAKGDKGETGPQGAKGDTGPGITAKAKSLILELFAGAAYGNTTMQTQLDALKTEWGMAEDPALTLVYSLAEPKTFVPANKEFIDTGVKLFESISPKPSWTILFEVQGGENMKFDISTHTLMHCMKEASPWPGLVVQINNPRLLQLNLYGTQVAFATGDNLSEFKSDKHRFAVRISGSKYDCWDISHEKAGTGSIANYADAVSGSLILGAMQDTSGTKSRFFDGTLYQCLIYNGAMSDEQITTWLNG